MKIPDLFGPHLERLAVARGQCALVFREELHQWFATNGFIRVPPRLVLEQGYREEYYEYNDPAELGHLCQWSWSFVELRYSWQNKVLVQVNLSRSGTLMEVCCMSHPHQVINYEAFRAAWDRRYSEMPVIRITTKSTEAFKKRFDVWTRNL